MSSNDPTTGFNPQCPGNGVCSATQTTTASCFQACGPGDCRTGYSCIPGETLGGLCIPTSFQKCDPAMVTSCTTSTSVTLADGGQASYPDACLDVGYDPFGACFKGCSVFGQTCGNDQACVFYLGEFCIPSKKIAIGMPCVALGDCVAGAVCDGRNVTPRLCRQYCGGPDGLACPANLNCVVAEPGVPTSRLGICAP